MSQQQGRSSLKQSIYLVSVIFELSVYALSVSHPLPLTPPGPYAEVAVEGVVGLRPLLHDEAVPASVEGHVLHNRQVVGRVDHNAALGGVGGVRRGHGSEERGRGGGDVGGRFLEPFHMAIMNTALYAVVWPSSIQHTARTAK